MAFHKHCFNSSISIFEASIFSKTVNSASVFPFTHGIKTVLSDLQLKVQLTEAATLSLLLEPGEEGWGMKTGGHIYSPCEVFICVC